MFHHYPPVLKILLFWGQYFRNYSLCYYSLFSIQSSLGMALFSGDYKLRCKLLQIHVYIYYDCYFVSKFPLLCFCLIFESQISCLDFSYPDCQIVLCKISYLHTNIHESLSFYSFDDHQLEHTDLAQNYV